MVKKILMLALMSLILSSCKLNSASEADEKSKLVIPEWVTKAPDDSVEVIYDKAETRFTTDVDAARLKVSKEAKKLLSKKLADKLQKAYIQELTSEKRLEGPGELRLRQAVRNKLKRFDLGTPTIEKEFVNPEIKVVYALAALDKAALQKRIEKRLAVLDAQLRDYVHVSDKGSHLNQLLSVVPALPTIEERKMLKSNLEALKEAPISLPNDTLASLLDRKITKMIDLMVISLDATTDETAEFEPVVTSVMAEQLINMTARKPDLTFRYFLEADNTVEKELNKVVLVADVDMVNNQGNTFATLSQSFQGMNKSQKAAEKEAIVALVERTMDTIVNSTIQYMNKVNRANHNR